MRVSRHVCFRTGMHPATAVVVFAGGAPYERVDDSDFFVFDMYEDDPRWPAIRAAMEADDIHGIPTTEFTKQEMQSAEWLTVRSQWHNGYPQPESRFGYLEITYDPAELCRECGAGAVQQDAFRLTKAPKWGTRHFFSLNWVYDELFADDTARAVLEGSGLTGFRFRPVKNKRGTETLPGVQQLVMEEIAAPGVVTGGRDIDAVNTCPVCGRVKHHGTGIGMHTFRREALAGMPDICRTHEIWGWGAGADRKFLVSQRMYRLLTDNRLARSLVFQPIQLTD